MGKKPAKKDAPKAAAPAPKGAAPAAKAAPGGEAPRGGEGGMINLKACKNCSHHRREQVPPVRGGDLPRVAGVPHRDRPGKVGDCPEDGDPCGRAVRAPGQVTTRVWFVPESLRASLAGRVRRSTRARRPNGASGRSTCSRAAATG